MYLRKDLKLHYRNSHRSNKFFVTIRLEVCGSIYLKLWEGAKVNNIYLLKQVITFWVQLPQYDFFAIVETVRSKVSGNAFVAWFRYKCSMEKGKLTKSQA